MRRAIKTQKIKREPKIKAHMMRINGNGKYGPEIVPNPKWWGIDEDKLIRAHKKSGLRELVFVVK